MTKSSCIRLARREELERSWSELVLFPDSSAMLEAVFTRRKVATDDY